MLACPYDGAHGLDQWIHHHVQHTPEAIAIIHGATTLSYRQLDDWANNLAATLSKWNLGREEPVCVLAPMGDSHIVAQLAIIRLGGSSVPMDVGFPDQRIHDLLRPLGTRLVITTESLKHRVKSFQTMIIPTSIPTKEPPTHSQDIPYPVRSDGNHRTHVLHTSGTTGIPKPVEILSKGITRVAFNTSSFEIKSTDRVAAIAAPSFDASLVEVWSTLSRGATVVVLPKDVVIDPYALVESFERFKITGLILTTALLNHVVSVIPAAFRTLDWLMSGGEKANSKVFKAILENGPPKALFNAYGPTEVTCLVSCHLVTPKDCSNGEIPIGSAIDGTTCFVLSEIMQPVGATEIGRLYVAGEGLARGYFGRQEANQKAFLHLAGHITDRPKAITRVYDTGDLVRRRSNGVMEFHGRADSQIKMRGYRVEPGEIESTLLDSNMLQGVFVAAVDRVGRDTYLVAFILPNESKSMNLNDLQAHMKRTLPNYMIPRIDVVERFPFTVHGKVDGRALVEAHLKERGGTEISKAARKPEVMSKPTNVKSFEDTGTSKEAKNAEDARKAYEAAKRAFEEAKKAEEGANMAEKLKHANQIREEGMREDAKKAKHAEEPTTVALKAVDSEANGPRYTTASDKSIINWLTTLWISLLEVGSITDDNDFFELGGSSLQASAMIVQIRRRFGKRITIQDVYENPTRVELSRLLESIEHDSSHTGGNQMDLMLADTQLARTIEVSEESAPDWTSPEEGHVFLTGATGFLGVHMLRELVDLSYIKTVRCLVRAADGTSGRKRLIEALEKYSLNDHRNLHKIVVVPGDLGKPQFGLSSVTWASLIQELAAVFHFAAHVNYVEQYDRHRDANVLGTVTALKLAAAGRIKPLHYTSSAAISGPARHFAGSDTVFESDLPQTYGDWIKYDIGYTQSKWVTEHLMQDMIDKGLPIVLYRPGFMMGASSTGHGNNSDFMARLFQGCIQIGCRPFLPHQAKSLVPVDYCTSALLHISSDSSNHGRTFHLTPQLPSDDIDLEELWAWLAQYGYALQSVPYKDWLERLTQDSGLLSNPLLPLLPVLQEPVQKELTRWELWNDMAFFDTTNTREALLGCAKPVSSRFSFEDLGRHLNDWKKKGLIVETGIMAGLGLGFST